MNESQTGQEQPFHAGADGLGSLEDGTLSLLNKIVEDARTEDTTPDDDAEVAADPPVRVEVVRVGERGRAFLARQEQA